MENYLINCHWKNVQLCVVSFYFATVRNQLQPFEVILLIYGIDIIE